MSPAIGSSARSTWELLSQASQETPRDAGAWHPGDMDQFGRRLRGELPLEGLPGVFASVAYRGPVGRGQSRLGPTGYAPRQRSVADLVLRDVAERGPYSPVLCVARLPKRARRTKGLANAALADILYRDVPEGA
ncbi:MAG: hypothetical protein U0271_28265 [Polyangiaceae bacterium]